MKKLDNMLKEITDDINDADSIISEVRAEINPATVAEYEKRTVIDYRLRYKEQSQLAKTSAKKVKASEKVLKILSESTVDNGVLKLVGQMERADYVEVNKVL